MSIRDFKVGGWRLVQTGHLEPADTLAQNASHGDMSLLERRQITGDFAMGDESTIRVTRLAARGQITIPAEFRRRLGLSDGSPLQVTLIGDRIEIRPLRGTGPHCEST